ncbi:MAG: hypothetical protein IJ512_07065 [Ruminococcus sp.]|nr:hypothetical protein [Ruminococcus sp.]
MANFKRLTAAAAAVAMMGSLAACGSNTAYAFTIDGEQVKAGLYIYYSYVAYNEAITTLTEQNAELDTTDDEVVKEQVIDGMDTLTWIQDKAQTYCEEHVAVNKEYEAEGLELTSEEISEIDASLESFWETNSESFEENGISEASIREVIEYTYKASNLFLHYYEIDGKEGITEEEVHDYYVDNNARVQYVRFDLVDGTGAELDDAGKKEIEEMVDDYLSAVEKLKDEDKIIEKMDEIQEEYNAYVTSISEEAVAATATSATDEEGNEIATTTTTTTTAADETTTTTTTVPYANESIVVRATTDEETAEEDITYSPSKTVHDHVYDEAEINKPAVVFDEDSNAYYLIVRYDIEERMNEEDIWTEDMKESVVSEMFSDAFQEKLTGWCDAMTVDVNASAIKRYDPFEIDLYSE